MSVPFFEEKLDGFRVDVIDRLARIETKHDQVIERLETLNGSVADHEGRIAEHEFGQALDGH